MEKHKRALDLLFLEVTKEDAERNCADAVRSFPVDVYTDDTNYIIQAELPGLKCEEVSIEYRDSYLEIEARKKMENGNYSLLRGERCYGTYRRSFFIEGIDEDSITASFFDGVLHIEIKKAGSL